MKIKKILDLLSHEGGTIRSDGAKYIRILSLCSNILNHCIVSKTIGLLEKVFSKLLVKTF